MNALGPVAEKTAGRRFAWLRAPRFWLGMALSLLALYLTVKDVQWSEVGAALAKADLFFLLLALGSVVLNTWAKVVRWRLLFYPAHAQLSMLNCTSALLVGQLANKLLPARLGDLMRAYFIGEDSGVSKLFALATTVVEKALDSVMLLLLIALLSLWTPIPSWLRRSSLLLSAVLAVLLLAVVLLANQRQRIVEALGRWMHRYRALAFLRLFRRLAEASAELRALRHVAVQARLWAWSVLVWALGIATNALVFRVLDLTVHPLASPLLMVVLMTGAILPTSPLQVGVFHYLCVVTLSLFGVERNVALSYAVVLHLVVHVPIVLGGVLGLWAGNYDFHRPDISSGG
jgi:uncharacterized protein (TIRG00374 family)